MTNGVTILSYSNLNNFASKLPSKKIPEFDRAVRVGCLLWQKVYFEVGKWIYKEDMLIRLAKNALQRMLWLPLICFLLNVNLKFIDHSYFVDNLYFFVLVLKAMKIYIWKIVKYLLNMASKSSKVNKNLQIVPHSRDIFDVCPVITRDTK